MKIEIKVDSAGIATFNQIEKGESFLYCGELWTKSEYDPDQSATWAFCLRSGEMDTFDGHEIVAKVTAKVTVED